jgi:hypothetical protein
MVLFFSCNEVNESKESNASKENQNPIDSSDLKVPSSNSLSSKDNAKAMISDIDESKLNLAQNNVQKLLASCVVKDFQTAASLIMYRGTEQSRVGKDSFNYANPKEANTVNVTCEVINNWLDASQSYEFISYNEELTEYGKQYIVEILFSKQKLGIERHFFYLMDSPKGLILVNMI